MDAPAFCDTCAAVFRSGIEIDGTSTAHVAGQEAGPCPTCGHTGHVPAGIFEFLGGTISLLSAPGISQPELKSLATILTEACGHQSSFEDIETRIQDAVPALAPVSGLIPDTQKELYAYLTLIVAVISLLIVSDENGNESAELTPERVLAHIIGLQESVASRPTAAGTRRPRRNALCHCGSGKRFKHCCGRG